MPTRWLCIYPVLSRLLAIHPTLTLYSESEDEALLALLTTLTTIVAGLMLLPLLRELNQFCLACQVRGMLAGELSQLLRVLQSSITAMYITPATCFGEAEFQQLHKWLDVDSSNSPLVWADGVHHQVLSRGVWFSGHAGQRL